MGSGIPKQYDNQNRLRHKARPASSESSTTIPVIEFKKKKKKNDPCHLQSLRRLRPQSTLGLQTLATYRQAIHTFNDTSPTPSPHGKWKRFRRYTSWTPVFSVNVTRKIQPCNRHLSRPPPWFALLGPPYTTADDNSVPAPSRSDADCDSLFFGTLASTPSLRMKYL